MSAAAATPEMTSAAGVKLHPADARANDASAHEELRWRHALGLPCLLTVELPIPHFSVSDLLALHVGSVIATNWRLAHDIPLRVNGTLIGWGEFEGAGKHLAVRLTELA